MKGRNKLVGIVICLMLMSPLVLAKLSGSLSIEAITQRLQPIGKINIEGADAAAARQVAVPAGGPKDIYEKNCKTCHQTGLAGAPKWGSKGDWAPRISQGVDALVKTAVNGIRAMPPKGNCIQCTEAEIKETVQFMIDSVK